MVFEVEASDGTYVAEVPFENMAISDCVKRSAQALANAHLIAAAPDLLAACEAIVLYDERPDDGPNAGIQMMADYATALDAARAAIAKARGAA